LVCGGQVQQVWQVRMTLLKTDRSRIERYEKCARLRYWSTEFDGTGLEPSDERGLKLDARIGTGVHDGIEFALRGEVLLANARSEANLAATFGANKYLKGIADDGIKLADLPEQQRNEVYEGANIVTALVYAWVRVRLPALLAEGGILAVEREMDVDFTVGDDVVRLMTRPDIVWRRKSDASVFIRNLKTVREPRTVWREQWALDMQTLTEPLAVDKWLADATAASEGTPERLKFPINYDDTPATCAGVIIDGLVTGSVLDYPRGSGKFYHNTPLLYAWVKKGDAPFGEDEFYPRYEWTCQAPHKMARGRCEGGRTHSLKGARKQAVADTYPGGILAWIDHLLEEDESVVQDQIIELPPIMRAPYAIERWKRQVLNREVDIAAAARVCNEAAPANDILLDRHFPMSTASGNCLRPGKCSMFDLCYGSAAADPYAANYRTRRPHHPQEEESQ
jgi:hypothetical protein